MESDKASMEIPSSHGGVVKEIKLGDKVAEGSVMLMLEAEGVAAAAPAPASSKPAAAPAVPDPSVTKTEAIPAPTAASFGGTADLECDLLVLGAGPGGYSASR